MFHRCLLGLTWQASACALVPCSQLCSSFNILRCFRGKFRREYGAFVLEMQTIHWWPLRWIRPAQTKSWKANRWQWAKAAPAGRNDWTGVPLSRGATYFESLLRLWCAVTARNVRPRSIPWTHTLYIPPIHTHDPYISKGYDPFFFLQHLRATWVTTGSKTPTA